MEKINVRKGELLAKVRENREAHQAIYDEAMAGYKELAEAQLEKHLADVRRGAVRIINIMMPAPTNQVKDYDRVIAMLEMEISDEIELDEQEFSQYVMDEWSWRRAFLTSNSTYSASAATALGN